jgi:hypothetical protein
MIASEILGTIIAVLLIAFMYVYFRERTHGHKERVFRFDFDDVQDDIATLFISVQSNKVIQLHILRSDGSTSEVQPPIQSAVQHNDSEV